VIAGLTLLLASLAIRGAAVNRYVRGRLLLSATVLAVYTVAAGGLGWLDLPAESRETIQALNPLLLTFALITLVVALAINPWRVDRLPDRFPRIVQDTIVIALFAVAASWMLRDRALATTAVGAVIVGLALQDTLGNLVAGLAVQIEKPFRVGDWVTLGGQDGVVSEITWRATKVRTKANNFVIVPNSVLARDTITNYSEPTRSIRLQVEVGASYDAPPNVVKGVIRDALDQAPGLAADRAPEVLLLDFGASAIVYRVYFWVTDFEWDEHLQDAVRTRIYYAFRRHGITIPYPIEVGMSSQEAGLAPTPKTTQTTLFDGVGLFATLTASERGALLDVARSVMYAAGERIVVQGQPGRSLFVMVQGRAAVTLAGTVGEVAQLGPGDVFGEMSLLTGEVRSATVTAVTDCDLLEIDAASFKRVILANPTVVERITTIVATRREELDRRRQTHATPVERHDARQSLLTRVRQFLGV
jgi:CRP-like cAMP-binding protein